MSNTAAKFTAYTRVDVETTSQGKLIVMLFNGAIKRAEEAKRQHERGNLESVHSNLVRSQDIVAELRGALNMQAGPIARELDRVYEYLQHLLITANVQKAVAPIDEALGHLANLRDTWEQVFAQMDREKAPTAPPPPANPSGSSMLNMRG